MRSKSTSFIGVLFFLVLATSHQLQAQDSLATVYFYPSQKFPRALEGRTFEGYEVKHGDVSIGRMTPGEVTPCRTKPGTQTFTAKVNSESSFRLTVEAGKTYFVECGFAGDMGRPTFRAATSAEGRGEVTRLDKSIILTPDKDDKKPIQSSVQNKTRFGLRLGYNSSIFSASVNSDISAKGGLNVGAYVDFKVDRNFHIQPEINYSSQGELENYTAGPGGPSLGQTTTTLNYLNIPIIFKADLGKVVSFQFGPQFGILLSGTQAGTINGQPINDDLMSVFKSDFSAVVGLGFNLSEHVNLGARANYGLTNIYTPPDGTPFTFPSISNRVLNFFLGYTF